MTTTNLRWHWSSLLAFAALILADVTVLTFVTGRPLLAVAGIAAGVGVYAAGRARAVHHYRPLLRQQQQLARTDRLTGLPNRVAVDEILEGAGRSGTLTVALIDVNGLHAVNNRLGLAAGDQYLTTTARRLDQAAPAGAVTARLGGDEFVLLAPAVDPQELADRIRAAFAARTVLAGYRIRPRVSVGIAATSPDGPVDARYALARADVALLAAKHDGGHRIHVFVPGRDPEPSRDGTRSLLRRRDINPLADTGLGWIPEPGDELIPVLLSPDDLYTLGQALVRAGEQSADGASGSPFRQLAARLAPMVQAFAGPADRVHDQQAGS